jgi:signal transduction histidine kinase
MKKMKMKLHKLRMA